MKWTQELPKREGYYWFCETYGGVPLCIYFTVGDDEVCTYSYYYNDPAYVRREDNCWFSSLPVSELKWESGDANNCR